MKSWPTFSSRDSAFKVFSVHNSPSRSKRIGEGCCGCSRETTEQANKVNTTTKTAVYRRGSKTRAYCGIRRTTTLKRKPTPLLSTWSKLPPPCRCRCVLDTSIEISGRTLSENRQQDRVLQCRGRRESIGSHTGHREQWPWRTASCRRYRKGRRFSFRASRRMPRPQSSIYGKGNASLHSRETHPCSRPIASCSVSSHVLPFKAAATSSISRRPSLAEKLAGLRPRRLASCWRDTGASPDRPAEPLPSAVQPEEGAGAKRGKEAWPRSACGWLCSSEIGHRMRRRL